MIEVNNEQVKEKWQGTQNSVKAFANNSREKLHHRYQETVDALQKTRQNAYEKAGKAITQLNHLNETVQEKVGTAVAQADHTVKTSPWKVLVTAVLAALFVGYWLKPAR